MKIDEYSPFRYYINKMKTRKKHGDLTLPYLKQLWEEQDGRCAYTGLKLNLQIPFKSGLKNDLRTLASLDRIDSSIPYMVGNVQYVSGCINLAKHSMSHFEMLEFIELIRNTGEI